MSWLAFIGIFDLPIRVLSHVMCSFTANVNTNINVVVVAAVAAGFVVVDDSVGRVRGQTTKGPARVQAKRLLKRPQPEATQNLAQGARARQHGRLLWWLSVSGWNRRTRSSLRPPTLPKVAVRLFLCL